MLLALDSATDFATVALFDGWQVLAESTWRSRRRHTVDLAPQVDAVMRLVHAGPADLTAVAVGIGPGSYTGTRVALSLAKGIVFALDLPLIGVSTLDAVAYSHPHAAFPVCAMVNAGRGRYAWALYDPQPLLASVPSAEPQRRGDWHLGTLQDIISQLTPPVHFAGELAAEDAATLHQRWHDQASVAPPATALRRAGPLAELAWRRFQAGLHDNPSSLSPIYLG